MSLKVGGLGLAIAKETVELLGGNITLISEKGKGSEFRVSVPYKTINSKTNKITVAKDSSNVNVKHNHIKILVVDDEAVNCFLLKTLLNTIFKDNYEIILANNGKEAVEICNETGRIDLVFMDIMIPVMNGYEATKLIKEKYPTIPVIAQTAYATKEDKEKAFSSGCDDFLSKPLVMDQIKSIKNKYLS